MDAEQTSPFKPVADITVDDAERAIAFLRELGISPLDLYAYAFATSVVENAKDWRVDWAKETDDEWTDDDQAVMEGYGLTEDGDDFLRDVVDRMRAFVAKINGRSQS